MSSIQFCCPFCSKLFVNESSGVQHAEVVHSKEAAEFYQYVPRECSCCFRSFDTAWKFIQHMELSPRCRNCVLQDQQQDTECGLVVEEEIDAAGGNVDSVGTEINAARKVSVGGKKRNKKNKTDERDTVSRKRKVHEFCGKELKRLRAATSDDVEMPEDAECVVEPSVDAEGQQHLTVRKTISRRKSTSNSPHIGTMLSESDMLSQFVSDPSVNLYSVIESLDADPVSKEQWKHTAYTMCRAMHGLAVSLYTEIIKCESEKLSGKKIKNRMKKHLLEIMASPY